jgi:hypothetical protein
MKRSDTAALGGAGTPFAFVQTGKQGIFMANYRTTISNSRKSKPPKVSKKRPPATTIAHRYSELQRLREILKVESRASTR